MSTFNSCTLVGNLGRDPEVKYTQAGKAFAFFSIAVDQGFGDKKKTIWLNVTTFDKSAEFVGKYLTKGNKVLVQGELTEDSYTDKETGQEKKSIKVIASRVVSLTPNPNAGSGSNGTAGQSQAVATPNITDEDIPF